VNPTPTRTHYSLRLTLYASRLCPFAALRGVPNAQTHPIQTRTPHRMIEYIVTHELVHLRERYHTPAFWERLERMVADYVERRAWLAEGREV
jgi:hypothetical protein